MRTVHRHPCRSNAGRQWLLCALFLAALVQSGLSFAEAFIRSPYLQVGTPNAVTIRWKTDTASTGRVWYGMNPFKLTTFVDEASSATDHTVQLSGLTADARYYYAVGNNTGVQLASGLNYRFVTSPPPGIAKPTRIWAIGDAGLNTVGQLAVRDAYAGFNGPRETDLLLFLGDNAYNTGTEAEYNVNHFAVYANQLRNMVSWTTIGNHDAPSAVLANHPHNTLFNFPTAGEAGGVPSGSRNYFSFDYGHVHVINLDSMASDRSALGPMANWLKLDLQANTKPWVVAMWHHPPYSKGSHNSDTELQLVEMRTNLLPILEQYGVDLVLGGHSHSYERSYLLNGHYGQSATLIPLNVLNSGDGRPSGNGAYTKPSYTPVANAGAVFVVAGSSGQISGFNFGGFHPAMAVSLNEMGSLVLDVTGNRLDATFVRDNSSTPDTFTLIKQGAGNPPAAVSITAPATSTPVVAGSNVNFTATASDPGGGVTQVVYFANGQQVGAAATVAPYAMQWANPPVGVHRITARATDSGGALSMSTPIFLNVASTFDIDANGQVDALTDGLLAIRYMFGLRDAPLTANATGPGVARNATQMSQFLSNNAAFDIDGNGQVDALTDGLLLLRYLFGLRNAQLTANALAVNATRTGPQIEAYLQSLIP